MDQTLELSRLYRDGRVESIATKQRSVKVSFSSEQPVQRSFGKEVLSHAFGACDLSRMSGGRGPVLLDHDLKKLVGRVSDIQIDSSVAKGFAVLKISRAPEHDALWQDIREGIRSNVSVGYEALEMEPAGKGDTYKVTKWKPVEISLVSVPADESCHIQGIEEHSADETTYLCRVLDSPKTFMKTNENNSEDESSSLTSERSIHAERSRCQEINAMVKRYPHMAEAGQRAIQDGTPAKDFGLVVLKGLSQRSEATFVQNDPHFHIRENHVHRYDLVRAMKLASELKPLDGLEAEVSSELARQVGYAPSGFFVPESYFVRDLEASTGSGGQLVPEILDSNLIDLLRNKAVLGQAGARTIGGLTGKVSFARQTGPGSVSWLSETAAAPLSDASFDQITLNAKRVSGQAIFSKSLIAQSSLDVQGIVRSDLMALMALAIDSAGLYGTGPTNNQPLGVFNQPGVLTSTFGSGAPTFAKVVAFEAAVESANALVDDGIYSYVTSPLVKQAWKTTPKVSSYPIYLWENNQVNNYPAFSTNQITNNAVVFANWQDLLIGSWNGLDMTVDPYSRAGNAQIVVTILQFLDVAVRHGASFCVSTDAGNQ